MPADKTIIKVWQDDIQLVLRFNVESIPDLAYVNTQLRERLHHEYDEDLIHMMQDIYHGTVDIFFCPNDDGSIPFDTWDALVTILEEYYYTLKDAKDIIMWIDENIKMDDQDHVYVQILEGARGL